MDLLLIKILDIVTEEDQETGDVLATKKIYLPSILKSKDVDEINPGITNKGGLYKNVSIIKKYSGESYTVVGNYKKLSEIIDNSKVRPQIGYGK